VLLLSLLACAPEPPPSALPSVTTQVYAGHASQPDPQALVAALPALAGTRLDDCRTCHLGWAGPDGPLDTCDGCHLIHHPPTAGGPPPPATYGDTLNGFGRAWRDAGRGPAALAAIGALDSDGDGATNALELAALSFPGDPASHPGQVVAPQRTLPAAAVQALPATNSFILLNTSKDVEDSYTTYTGARLLDLLVAAGVDLAQVQPTGVTVFAADGYAHTLPWEHVRTAAPPTVVEPGLDKATLGDQCGWVRYPNPLPTDPAPPWVLLAWAREGQALTPSVFDEERRLRGEGPSRLVVPARGVERPDRGGRASPSGCDDGRDYDPSRPHNAGAMVRGVVALRVDPMPTDVDPPDLTSIRHHIETGAITVFGLGITDPSATVPPPPLE
jgi:hypothetical protein